MAALALEATAALAEVWLARVTGELTDGEPVANQAPGLRELVSLLQA